MAWLLIENHLHLKDIFFERRIPCAEFTIQKPIAVTGMAFPDTYITNVREIEGLEHFFDEGKAEAVVTDVVDILLVRDIKVMEEEVEKTSRVSFIDGGNFQAKKEIEPVLEKYAVMLGMDIVAANPHGSASYPESFPGTLYVKFYTTPINEDGGNNGQKKIASLFDIKLRPSQDDAMKPTYMGEVLLDEYGVPFAEVYKDTLFIYFDLPHVSMNSAKLMSLIMEHYVACLVSKGEKIHLSEDIMKRRMKAEAKELKNSRTEYIKECRKRVDSMLIDVDKNLGFSSAELDTISIRMVELTRSIDILKDQKVQLTSKVYQMDTKFADEYEKLLKVPRVKKVIAKNGIVSVFTETVILDFDDKLWELGDYHIDIHSSGKLSIKNLRVRELTNQHYYHHPHVFGDDGSGHCLGNIREGVMRLIGEYEYSVVAQIIIEFLHTVRDKSEYIGYLKDHWKPIKKPKEVPNAELEVKPEEKLISAIEEKLEARVEEAVEGVVADTVEGAPTEKLEVEPLDQQLKDFLAKNDGIPKKKRAYRKKTFAKVEVMAVSEAMRLLEGIATEKLKTPDERAMEGM